MKDKKVNIPLTDSEFFLIAKLAHKYDITFNHMVERILAEAMLKELKTRYENPNLRRFKRKNRTV